jgi:hypothetical protein
MMLIVIALMTMLRSALSFVEWLFYLLINWLNTTIPLAPYGGILSALSVVFDILALVLVFRETKLLHAVAGRVRPQSKHTSDIGGLVSRYTKMSASLGVGDFDADTEAKAEELLEYLEKRLASDVGLTESAQSTLRDNQDRPSF